MTHPYLLTPLSMAPIPSISLLAWTLLILYHPKSSRITGLKISMPHLVQHFGLQMAAVKLFSLPSSKFCTAFAELGLGKKVVGAVNGERWWEITHFCCSVHSKYQVIVSFLGEEHHEMSETSNPHCIRDLNFVLLSLPPGEVPRPWPVQNFARKSSNNNALKLEPRIAECMQMDTIRVTQIRTTQKHDGSLHGKWAMG